MADDEDEWRFELDEVGEDDADAADSDGAADTDAVHDAADRDIAGEHEGDTEGGERATDVIEGVGADRPIEPGSPRIENAVFVLLGVLAAVVLVADFLSLAGL